MSLVPLFVVTRSKGSEWREGGGQDQIGFEEHERFIDGLVQQGVVKVAGPLEDGRALLIVEATDKDALRDVLAPDPWSPTGNILPIESIMGWTIRLGTL